MLTTGERPALAKVVAANVFRLRVSKVPRWSRRKLGALAGLSAETIRDIEEGRGNAEALDIGVRGLEVLARALGVPPEELALWDETLLPYLRTFAVIRTRGSARAGVFESEEL